MTLFVVETQRADYLFACPSAAESFAAGERRWWNEHCPGGGWGRIEPVALATRHQFNRTDPDCPLEPGPGQEYCRRVRRHVRRWWNARDAWWNQIAT